MPPLWLIVGTVVIIGLTSAVDQMILGPSGTTEFLDGRPVSVRRKRDGQLLMTALLGALIAFFLLGISLFEEGNLLFAFVSAVPLAAILIWSLVRAIRDGDITPIEREIRASKDVGNRINRHSWQALAAVGAQVALGALLGAVEGTLFWILLAVNFALFPVEIWLLWRFLRMLRRIGAGGAPDI